MIKALAQHHVKDIAAGSHHCLALTDQGEVFGWGANTNREVGAEAGESIPVPTLLSEASKCGVVYIACGSHEVSICSALAALVNSIYGVLQYSHPNKQDSFMCSLMFVYV